MTYYLKITRWVVRYYILPLTLSTLSPSVASALNSGASSITSTSSKRADPSTNKKKVSTDDKGKII